jgi:hypothetical protein
VVPIPVPADLDGEPLSVENYLDATRGFPRYKNQSDGFYTFIPSIPE